MIYPWQSQQWQQLQSQVREQRLPHALLLTGQTGLGKCDFAIQLAKSLLCKQPQASGEACGECDACLLLQVAPVNDESNNRDSALTHMGTHPDCLWLEPEEADKAIKVDDIRALCAAMSLTSQYGGYKVAVINMADSMNMNAANSLLKTLEEPGANTVLILVSSRPQRLPITVRSRCQRISFYVPVEKLATDWLAQQKIANSELMLRLAHGAPLLAQQLAQADALQPRQLLVEALLGVARNQSLVSHAEGLSKLPAPELLGWLHDWLADVLRLQSSAQAEITNLDYAAELRQLAQQLNMQRVYGLLDEVLNLRRMQTVSLNAQLLWEDLLISWQLLVKRA
ncbi:MAG: polymerase subunit delta [Pseudomonadota bacterium]|nr:polymerase subunit delta [Pseudomonadota bacterium]